MKGNNKMLFIGDDNYFYYAEMIYSWKVVRMEIVSNSVWQEAEIVYWEEAYHNKESK